MRLANIGKPIYVAKAKPYVEASRPMRNTLQGKILRKINYDERKGLLGIDAKNFTYHGLTLLSSMQNILRGSSKRKKDDLIFGV